jgi:hypothetical protein
VVLDQHVPEPERPGEVYREEEATDADADECQVIAVSDDRVGGI